MNPPTRPTDGPNYGPLLVKPVPLALSSTQAAPAPVSPLTGDAVIKANLDAAAQQNRIVGAGSGRAVGGGSKRKRSHKHKRSNKHKRSHKRSHTHKRSSHHKRPRNKRGGNPTNPTTRPTVTVPQFGDQHPGANSASVNLNGGAMLQTEQSKFDSVNQPPKTTYLQ